MHGGRGKKRLRQLFVEIFHLFFCALPEIREGKRGGVENIYIQVERRGRTWRTLPKTAANVGEAPRERRGSPVADRYSGYYEHSLDPKGRITIPSKFREQLGKTIAMMRGRNNCICLYSLSEWNAVYEKFEKIEESDEVSMTPVDMSPALPRMRMIVLKMMVITESNMPGAMVMSMS